MNKIVSETRRQNNYKYTSACTTKISLPLESRLSCPRLRKSLCCMPSPVYTRFRLHSLIIDRFGIGVGSKTGEGMLKKGAYRGHH